MDFRDLAYYRSVIELTDDQAEDLSETMRIIKTDARAAMLYARDLAELTDPSGGDKILADDDTLETVFGERKHMYAVAVLFGRLPWLREQYAQYRIPESVLRATLTDIPIWMRVCKQTTGRWGLIEYAWLTHHFRFRLFRLGALEFIPSTLPVFGIDDKPGMKVLEVHVPEGTDLSPQSVDESFETALEFFRTTFDYVPERFVCESWLLDPALQALMPDSRIAAFGRRFKVVSRIPSAHQTVERVFGFDITDYREGPRITRLQKAVGEWLDNGNPCCEGRGYIEIKKALH